MDEIISVIQDSGIYVCIIGLILFLGLKYLPQFIEIKLTRMKEKDYMLDGFKSVIENNSQVIANNSKVIELNSSTIKNYTDNANKLEKEIHLLTDDVKESNTLMRQASVDIKILKDRGDKQ